MIEAIEPQVMPNFSVIIPRPWRLSEQDKNDLDKIRDECMDKIRQWETRISPILSEYQLFSDAWRVKSRPLAKKPNTLFNSKSGEAHRATETLASFWLRSLTATDPFHEAVPEGLNWNGQQLTSDDLYTVETIITKQLQWAHFKEKLHKILRSVSHFGTVIAEKPFMSLPYGADRKNREYTDLILRPLILTAFDTSVFDIRFSDYIATIDFPSKWALRNMAQADDDLCDKAEVERIINQFKDSGSYQTAKKSTAAWSRVMESKQRAGYTNFDADIYENIRYHGRIETDNSVVQSYWESMGRQDDPNLVDFTMGILNGDAVWSFHMAQYGDWRTRFAIAHYKNFELEPYAYGVAKIGRKYLKELDITESRMNDTLAMALNNMWIVSKYAGIKASQLGIKPQGIIETEDINQIKPLPHNLDVVEAALGLMGIKKEDYRTMVGAYSNLQAQAQKGGTATEAALLQNEAIRGASVHAEIISETFLRDYIETCHMNNLNYLDTPIWVSATGSRPPQYHDKDSLPSGIGFSIKVVTDKDFRPERNKAIIEALQISTSIRNDVPASLNVIDPLYREYFRGLGMNPRLLDAPIPMAQQLQNTLKIAEKVGQLPQLQNEMDAEIGGEKAGSGAQMSTPVGQVPTSPFSASELRI